MNSRPAQFILTVVLLISAFLLRLPAGETAAPETAPAFQAEDILQVYNTLQTHCSSCHGGHLERGKAGFSHVLDLKRLREGDAPYLVPGKPDDSMLLTLMTDPDFPMPPEESGVPPVPANEIAHIRAWIQAGAPWQAGEKAEAQSEKNKTASDPPSQDSTAGMAPPDVLIGNLHPLLVHLPAALLVLPLLLEGWNRLRPSAARVWCARFCLIVGAVGAGCSAITGWVAAGTEGYAADTVFNHRWLGISIAVLSFLLALLSKRIRGTEKESAPGILWLLLLALLALLVMATGHTGGVLVHGNPFWH